MAGRPKPNIVLLGRVQKAELGREIENSIHVKGSNGAPTIWGLAVVWADCQWLIETRHVKEKAKEVIERWEDVTHLTSTGEVDDECLPITQCLCGTNFPNWHEILGIYKDSPWKCPKCGVELVFSNQVRVLARVKS